MTHLPPSTLARLDELKPEEQRKARDHLAQCPLCQLIRGSITGEASEAVLPVGQPTLPDRPDPERGQLWRLEWSGQVLLGLITHHDRQTVTLLPVTNDPLLIPDPLAILEPEEGLGFEAGVWRGPAIVVPWFVLDRYYGEFDIDLPDEPTDPDVVREGTELIFRQIQEAAQVMGAASWTGGGKSLPELAHDAGVSLRDVGEILGPPRRLAAVMRGSEDPSQEELAALSGLLKVPAEKVQGSPPEDLIFELNRPARRPLIRARVKAQEEEATTRRAIARELLAPAARTDRGAETATYWRERVDEYFAE